MSLTYFTCECGSDVWSNLSRADHLPLNEQWKRIKKVCKFCRRPMPEHYYNIEPSRIIGKDNKTGETYAFVSRDIEKQRIPFVVNIMNQLYYWNCVQPFDGEDR